MKIFERHHLKRMPLFSCATMRFMKHMVRNIEELRTLARALIAKSSIVNHQSAIVMALSGELGAGKTTFTQAVAAELGVHESVTSPTFVILKVYALANQLFERLVHIDAYRLEAGSELASLGFDDLAHDPKNLILIEWPEHVADVLPEERIDIKFCITGEEEREIEVGMSPS